MQKIYFFLIVVIKRSFLKYLRAFFTLTVILTKYYIRRKCQIKKVEMNTGQVQVVLIRYFVSLFNFVFRLMLIFNTNIYFEVGLKLVEVRWAKKRQREAKERARMERLNQTQKADSSNSPPHKTANVRNN